MTEQNLPAQTAGTPENNRSAAWRVLAALALALATAGFLNMIVNWLPPKFNSSYWRFMVIGSTIDSFNVITVSLFALAVSLIALRADSFLKLFAAVSTLLAAGMAVLYTVFMGTLARIHELVESAAQAEDVADNVLRASLFAICGVVVLGGLAVYTWRLATRLTHART